MGAICCNEPRLTDFASGVIQNPSRKKHLCDNVALLTLSDDADCQTSSLALLVFPEVTVLCCSSPMYLTTPLGGVGMGRLG